MDRMRLDKNIDGWGGETAALHLARTPDPNRRDSSCHEK
jgi:hypothetical protein